MKIGRIVNFDISPNENKNENSVAQKSIPIHFFYDNS